MDKAPESPKADKKDINGNLHDGDTGQFKPQGKSDSKEPKENKTSKSSNETNEPVKSETNKESDKADKVNCNAEGKSENTNQGYPSFNSSAERSKYFRSLDDYHQHEFIKFEIKTGRLGGNGTLSLDKQSRHRGSNAGNLNKSSVTIGSDVIVELYHQFAGSGELRFNSDGENVKEKIKDAGVYIGVYRNLKGKKIKTKAFKIHYSKNDFHIVPDIPNEYDY